MAEALQYAWAPEMRAPILVNVSPDWLAGGEVSEELSPKARRGSGGL